MQKYKIIYLAIIFLMYSSSSRSEDTVHNTKILEDYLNTIENMSFIFEQYSPNQEKVLGWMQIEKPNKLRSGDFFKNLGITSLDIYFDPDFKLVKTFKMRGLPTSILIDKNGKEFGRVVGEIDFKSKESIRLLKKYI